MHSSINTGKAIKAERKLLLTAFYDLYEYDSLWRKVSHPFLCFKVAEHLNIRKTCPCNVYPLEPHFYIAKLGYAGVYLFFLFLLQNIDCGYLLEPPRRGGSNVYPQSMFGFLIFAPKHRLWVLVRTASARRF